MSRARDFADLAGSADAGGLTGRNLLINGSKVIDQRNGGSSVSVAAGNVKDLADRWKADIGGGVDGVFSAQQQTSVVPTGFQYATKLTVTTVHSTSGTAHYYRYYYAGIEGYDTNQLELGTSNAKTVTVSFYVRSSVTGTYCLGLQNEAFNRAYSAEYSISSADTWERKEVTVALDQAGTWVTGNGAGLKLFWDLGSGSTYNMAADAWAATNTWKTSNQTAWIENASATFYITGVQLEVGEQATPFEHRSFGDELQRCRRYFIRTEAFSYYVLARWDFNADVPLAQYTVPVEMRAAPSVSVSTAFAASAADNGYGGTPTFGNINKTNFYLAGDRSISANAVNYLTTGKLDIDAEL